MRVLVVLADTDRHDTNLTALDLHAALVRRGFEVRTVALGPGRRGGLETVVPVLSPSRRSAAAVLQLRREARWAEAVLAAAPEATRAARRAARRLPVRELGADVVLAPTLDRAGPVVTPAQRSVARAELGLPAAPDCPVLWWTGPSWACDPAVEAVASGRGWPLLGTGRPLHEHAGELVCAAADVAVLTGEAAAVAVPRELLRAASAGCALVGPAALCGGELLDAGTGAPVADGDVAGALASMESAHRRADAGAAARRRAEERFVTTASVDAVVAELGS